MDKRVMPVLIPLSIAAAVLVAFLFRDNTAYPQLVLGAGVEFSDTFTGSGELSIHSPDTGTGWSEIINNGNDIVISGNAIECDGGLSDGSLYTTDDTMSNTDYRVEVDATDPDGSDDTNWIAARVADTNNMYAVSFNEDLFVLYKKVSGSWSALSSNQGGIVSPGDVVYLDVTGTTISAGVNDVEQVSVTDSAISSAGSAGVGIGNIGQGSGQDCSGQIMDNFVVTVAAGGGGDPEMIYQSEFWF